MTIPSYAAQPGYTLVDMFRFLGRNWWFMGVGAVVGLLLGTLGIWLTPVMYTASAVVTPAQPTQQTRLGDLIPAALLSGGGDAGAMTQRAVVTVKSREFLDRFIRQRGLASEGQEARFWSTVQERIDLIYDPTVMTLTVKWETPGGAAAVANALIADVNALMRERAMAETTQLISYLNARAEETTDLEMRSVIYSLIHEQLKTQMLAQARDEYAFIVVDPAYPPEDRSQPRPMLLLTGGVMVGAILGLLAAALWSVVRQVREGASSH